MAGLGSRFLSKAHSNREYLKPKPLIRVLGRPLIWWAAESLSFFGDKSISSGDLLVGHEDCVFVVRRDHEENFSMTAALEKIFSDQINVVVIDEPTSGALETCLAAKSYIDNDEGVLVCDCDIHFDGNALYKVLSQIEKNVLGVIPVFKPGDREPRWSFSLLADDGRVLEVGEKDARLAKAGAWANIGAYFFASGHEFVKQAEGVVKQGIMFGGERKKEFYIAPLYNFLLKKGQIRAAKIQKFWSLGTPEDVELFKQQYKNGN